MLSLSFGAMVVAGRQFAATAEAAPFERIELLGFRMTMRASLEPDAILTRAVARREAGSKKSTLAETPCAISCQVPSEANCSTS